MPKPCPECNGKIDLVQSTPTAILLCKNCGTFFDAALENIGNLRDGLDLDKLPTKPIPLKESALAEKTANQEQNTIPQTMQQTTQENSNPSEKQGGIMSVVTKFQHTGIVCPKCNSDGMKQLVSKITGNVLYACQRCGYTGTNYAQA